jgi:putative transposase
MRKSRFMDSWIMDALRRVEAGIKVPDLCRELGSALRCFTAGGPNMAAWMCR